MSEYKKVRICDSEFMEELGRRALVRVSLNDLEKLDNDECLVLLKHGSGMRTTYGQLTEALQGVVNKTGEWGCPEIMFERGTPYPEKTNRFLETDPSNVALRFKLFNIVLNEEGPSYIEAGISPTGPKGKYLKELLEDPNEKISFGIRAFKNKEKEEGSDDFKHTLKSIVTWDVLTK